MVITRKVITAGELLGIQVLDHVIIGHNKYESVPAYMSQNRKPIKDDAISLNYLRQEPHSVIKQVISEDISVYIFKKRMPITIILSWKEYEKLTV